MVMVKAANEMLVEILRMNVLIHTIHIGRREQN